MGALVCARLIMFVKKALNLDFPCTITCWTDSTIALRWIKGDSNKKDVFVRNRIRDIQQLTPPSSRYHCEGKENPADLMTRGILAEKLVDNSL